jgi:acetolactate synthase-1/2/3 large subunit
MSNDERYSQMPTVAEVLAHTLRDAGVERMYGLPGGEILDFIEAARNAGIEFVLVRHEAVAAFMADVSGQIERKPGVCVSTLGPGAMNLTLGVANAYLDRSPLIAITASMSTAAAPYATHQQLDLNAVFRPFTKQTVTLDGVNTAATVRRAWRTALTPRCGPVHIALPSDVARQPDRQAENPAMVNLSPESPPAPRPEAVARMADEIARARRPVLILGVDLNPLVDPPAVRRFAEALGAPVFATPKAKGIFPEDHPQFFGVCSGLAADSVIVDFFKQADLLVGVGFDPVESDKVWHQTMKLVSIAPVSIEAGQFRPALELIGDTAASLTALAGRSHDALAWSSDDEHRYRARLEETLIGRSDSTRPTQSTDPTHPTHPTHQTHQTHPTHQTHLTHQTHPTHQTQQTHPTHLTHQTHPTHLAHPTHPTQPGLSALAVTRRLRDLFPADTVMTTDVGSIKLIVSQAWRATRPLTFFESNGLSAMGYGLPAAMAAKLAMPDRPVLCTMGDGGFSMVFADLETCVRRRIPVITVVYNDCALSLIQVAQQRRGQVDYGVRYGAVDFAAASAALGAWSRHAATLEELEAAVREAQGLDVPAVIEVPIDPAEYHAHAR